MYAAPKSLQNELTNIFTSFAMQRAGESSGRFRDELWLFASRGGRSSMQLNL